MTLEVKWRKTKQMWSPSYQSFHSLTFPKRKTFWRVYFINVQKQPYAYLCYGHKDHKALRIIGSVQLIVTAEKTLEQAINDTDWIAVINSYSTRKQSDSLHTHKSPRDNQRKRLYMWESAWFKKHFPVPENRTLGLPFYQMTLQEVRTLYATHLKALGIVKQPELRMKNNSRGGAYCSTSVIQFNQASSCNMWIAVHELSHWIVNALTYRTTKRIVAGHGAEYCWVYAQMIAKVWNIPVDTIIRSMRFSGLDVSPSAEFVSAFNSANS